MKVFNTVLFIFLFFKGNSQTVTNTLSLKDILLHIQTHSSHLSMFDAQAASLDAAAKGSHSWMPPEFATGFWMTPYNPKFWKGSRSNPGMGQYMLSGQQTFPDKKKQDAELAYLSSMSAVTKEQRIAKENELFAEARKNFCQWFISKKKITILNEDLKILSFMIESAEIRYRNATGKIGAYYKAKAAIGSINNMKILAENEIDQRRISLNTLMHMPSNSKYEIDSVDVNFLTENLEFDTTTIVQNRSDVKVFNQEIILTNLEQKMEKSKLRPEYGIRYDHMFGFGGLPMQFTLMGMVKIPFAKWSSKKINANMESLRFKANAQLEERKGLINESVGMAYALKAEIETKQKQLSLYDNDIIPALKRNYQTTLLAYQQNTEDLFVLYDSWEKLNLIKLEYLDIKQQLFTNIIELDKVLENKVQQ